VLPEAEPAHFPPRRIQTGIPSNPRILAIRADNELRLKHFAVYNNTGPLQPRPFGSPEKRNS
jgi:hypothetical protein